MSAEFFQNPKAYDLSQKKIGDGFFIDHSFKNSVNIRFQSLFFNRSSMIVLVSTKVSGVHIRYCRIYIAPTDVWPYVESVLLEVWLHVQQRMNE